MTVLRGTGALSPTFEGAFVLAADVHREQRRKGTDIAYLSHLLSVSALVLEDGGTEQEAIAGLLHDALEDGPPGTRERVARDFGDDVLRMVEECTDDEPLGGHKRPWRERKTGYVTHLETASPSALRVTTADKLHNLRCTLDDLHMEKLQGATPTWPTSNACVHQNLWYYASVLDSASRRLPTSRVAQALDRTLCDVTTLLGVDRPVPSLLAPSCTCPGAAP